MIPSQKALRHAAYILSQKDLIAKEVGDFLVTLAEEEIPSSGVFNMFLDKLYAQYQTFWRKDRDMKAVISFLQRFYPVDPPSKEIAEYLEFCRGLGTMGFAAYEHKNFMACWFRREIMDKDIKAIDAALSRLRRMNSLDGAEG